MNRYSSGHTVLHAGAFVLPLLPVVLTTERYERSYYDFTAPDIAGLWIAGFGISYLLILVHELGHLAVARLIGLEIAQLTIGHWRKFISFPVGSLTVTIRAAPDSGSVVPKPSARILPLPGMMAFLAAGVVAEAVVVFAALWFFEYPRQIESFGGLLLAFSRTTVICLGCSHIVLNLWPGTAQLGGDRILNDGQQMLNLWKSRKHRPEQARILSEFETLNRQCAVGEFGPALETARELIQRHPDNVALAQCLASLHSELGDTRQAEAIQRELLTRPLDAEKLAEILDNLACLPLYYDRRDLLPDSDAWTNEALRHAPSAITLKGTRGSVLIELGRIDEGLPLLHEVLKRSECPVDHAIGAAYLAKVHALRGDRDEAKRWLEKALKLGAEHKVVRRISQEIERMPA